ncbi:hypothetical protein BDY24DRAFT_391142 [Mrakia frigida]|uniref:uncharacterized protein n=1 Tax=Mrakia frigida TaxID=29902 RepID=UPI003FCC1F93
MSSSQPETPTPPSLANKMSSLYSSLSSKASQVASNVSTSIPQHPALDSIQNQLRSFHQHHIGGSTPISTRALQLAITSEKTLCLDLLAASRDGSLASKEIYEWSKTLEENDLVDATDRLSYLSFSAAQLSGDLAKELDRARQPLKELRDLQIAIEVKHNQFKEASAKKKPDQDLIGTLNRDLTKLTDSLPLRRREAVIKSNQQTWQAYTEYSSKLLLLSHASSLLIPTLESGEWDKDYASHVRSSAQIALETFEPGKFITVNSWPEPGSAPTPSFSESHQTELSSVHRDATAGGIVTSSLTRSDSLPSDVARQHAAQRIHLASHHSSGGSSASASTASSPPPVEAVGALNFSPTEIPELSRTSSGEEYVNRGVEKGGDPTVAETGIPLTSGPEGPGPISGQLRPRTNSQTSPLPTSTQSTPYTTSPLGRTSSLPSIKDQGSPDLPPRVMSPMADLPPVFAEAPITDETAAIEERARQGRRGSLNPFSDEIPSKGQEAGGPPGYTVQK